MLKTVENLSVQELGPSSATDEVALTTYLVKSLALPACHLSLSLQDISQKLSPLQKLMVGDALFFCLANLSWLLFDDDAVLLLYPATY